MARSARGDSQFTIKMRLLLTLALVGTACAQELTSQEGTIVARSVDGM